ncbi:GDSL-like lipase/acylhydrolase [Bacillus phage vB_BhaS-171]|uniref:GDSL-like lipase/acylhydrolase n=1 Tax=Bacillus phage vB_BhaS-171 TaxID=1775140 RepID=UPI0007449A2A|nr:GDSL-like lipase/acylhydrolase [Bacillus phage vB_BhaS-171]ALY08076.1 GDSL-like lipase/acylhydrolase [Bacillus phage vB_BhaS-171]
MSVKLKTTDSWDVIHYTLPKVGGNPVDLTGATVRFLMAKKGSVTPVVNAEAEIVDALNGKVKYTLKDTDTLEKGMFNAEFQVEFADEKRKTFPSEGYLMVHINSNLDGSQAGLIEERIVIQVSEIEQFKEDIDARATAVEQAIVDVDVATTNANDAADRANTASSTAETRITELEGVDAVQFHERQNEFDVQLAQKALDSEVRKKSVLIGLNDVSNDLASAISGGTTLNVLSIPRNKSVTPTKTTFLDIGDNKFDKTDPEIVDGYYLSQTGTPTANSNLFISGKIPVSSGEVYSIPYINLIGDTTSGVYYNENDEVVTFVTGVTQANNTHRVITVPTNDSISYMKVNLRILFKDSSMVVKGNTYPSTYADYKVSFSNKLGLNSTQKTEVSALAGGNPLSGKIVSFNGDSIMYGQGYMGGFAKIIADRNNMIYENIAVSGGTITPGQLQSDGTTLRHSISGTIGNMRADADYVILEGGVNDASLGVTLGTMTGEFDFTSTLNTSTFCGAFEDMLKKAINRYKGKKIGFVITHKMLSAFGTYYTNMVSILQKWGIPYCDLYKGVPSLNYIADLKTTYTLNSDGWHPNEEGYRKYYVDKIEAWMKAI